MSPRFLYSFTHFSLSRFYFSLVNLIILFSESETWQCMLCTNVLDCSDDISNNEKRSNGMNSKELRIAQRIVLELYCQYEQSLPFREIVSSEVDKFLFDESFI